MDALRANPVGLEPQISVDIFPKLQYQDVGLRIDQTLPVWIFL